MINSIQERHCLIELTQKTLRKHGYRAEGGDGLLIKDQVEQELTRTGGMTMESLGMVIRGLRDYGIKPESIEIQNKRTARFLLDDMTTYLPKDKAEKVKKMAREQENRIQ